MTARRIIRKDEKGLYVNINGSKHRPGKVVGYDHVYRMDAGSLVSGDVVTVYNVAYTPLCKILCYENGKSITLHWYAEYA